MNIVKKEIVEAENNALEKLKRLVKSTSIYTNDHHALQMAKYLSAEYRKIRTMWLQAIKQYLYKVE